MQQGRVCVWQGGTALLLLDIAVCWKPGTRGGRHLLGGRRADDAAARVCCVCVSQVLLGGVTVTVVTVVTVTEF